MILYQISYFSATLYLPDSEISYFSTTLRQIFYIFIILHKMT